MTNLALLAWATAAIAAAQPLQNSIQEPRHIRITFSPFDIIGKDATAWAVRVCPADGAALVYRGDELFQMLAIRGADPKPIAIALRILHEAPARSLAGRFVQIVGYLAVGGGVILNTRLITVDNRVIVGLHLGGAFISVLLPLVRRSIPEVSPIEGDLIGPFLPVPAGACGAGVFLGGPGNAFEVQQ